MSDIHICYNINSDFLDLSLSSISSVRKFFRSNQDRLQFHIICTDEIDCTSSDVKIHRAEKTDVSVVQSRVFIPEILNNINRVIYIDSDTLVTTCISKLWKQDLRDMCVGMVPHYFFKSHHDAFDFYQFDKHLLSDKPYYNTGVMLIDCEVWRSDNISQKCVDSFKQYSNTAQHKNDEPGINLALAEHTLKLDTKWNHFPARDKVNHSCIIHYYGLKYNQKPQHDMFKW